MLLSSKKNMTLPIEMLQFVKNNNGWAGLKEIIIFEDL